MKFSEVAAQSLTWLQREGRVSYRALKREFELDDDLLEDLKEELCFSHPEIADEDGRGLVWTGGEETRESENRRTENRKPRPSTQAPSTQPQTDQLHACPSGRAHPRGASGAGSAWRNRR